MAGKFRRIVSLTVTSTCINIYHHYAEAWNVNIIWNNIFIGFLNYLAIFRRIPRRQQTSKTMYSLDLNEKGKEEKKGKKRVRKAKSLKT